MTTVAELLAEAWVVGCLALVAWVALAAVLGSRVERRLSAAVDAACTRCGHAPDLHYWPGMLCDACRTCPGFTRQGDVDLARSREVPDRLDLHTAQALAAGNDLPDPHTQACDFDLWSIEAGGTA